MGRKLPQWLLDASSAGNNKNLKKANISRSNINRNLLSPSHVDSGNVKVVENSAKNQKTDCMGTDDESLGMQSHLNVKIPIASDGASASSTRDSCNYGVKCFRRNPSHRAELAHPGDSDYSQPTFSDAAPGTPLCSWGANCYRRNPEHFIEFSHPPAGI